MFYAYLCENHPPFPHGDKAYDRDHVFFLTALVPVGAVTTWRRNDDGMQSPESLSVAVAVVDHDDDKDKDNKDETNQKKSLHDNDKNHDTQRHSHNRIHNYHAVENPSNALLNRQQTEEWKGW